MTLVSIYSEEVVQGLQESEEFDFGSRNITAVSYKMLTAKSYNHTMKHLSAKQEGTRFFSIAKLLEAVPFSGDVEVESVNTSNDTRCFTITIDF